MPRTNDYQEIIKYLNYVYKFTVKSGGASTTTAEAITQDMADTDVAAITNMTANDYLLITGSGGDELARVASTAAGPPANVTWEWPLYFAQNSGATVVEMEQKTLNHIAEGGISFGVSQTGTDINAATSRTALTTFTGPATFTFSIPMLGLVGQNLQTAMGAPEVEIGAGTSGDPYASGVNGSNVGTEDSVVFRCVGTYADGDTYVFDILGVTVEANVQATLGSPNPGGITVQGKASGFLLRRYT